MFSLFETNKKLKTTDNSGFLAIANPDTYHSFVVENWELPQLVNHFVDEMNRKSLIIWATGVPGVWTVLFGDKASDKKAFREFSRTINIMP